MVEIFYDHSCGLFRLIPDLSDGLLISSVELFILDRLLICIVELFITDHSFFSIIDLFINDLLVAFLKLLASLGSLQTS